jgi:ATP-binding cassette subfamily F protein uup
MQKSISLKNVEYSVNEKHILKGVSFRCEIDERLCLFGENGAGKSTLLKILSGELEAEKGNITKEGHIRFVYVSQEFDKKHSGITIQKYIEFSAGKQYFKKVYEFGDRLGFNLEKNNEKICGNLSGGQQKILALSVAFSMNPDYLLLDEPENHIDIVSRMVLIEMLKEYRGGIIFISHDRLIIDSVATKIGELVNGKLHISEGGYEDYIQVKMERLGGLQREYDKETKRIKELNKALIILQQKAFRGHDISQYRQRKAELEELRMAHKINGRPEDSKTRIKLNNPEDALHKGKLLIRIKSGSFGYHDNDFIFKDVSLEIRSGSKITLLGRNGTGKSTFLKCLMREKNLTEGEVVTAEGVKVSYFDQHVEFSPEENALDIVSKKLNLGDVEAKSALGAIKFDLNKMRSPIKNLSGGERMRLRFAITFGLKPDLLILDEPTNHIDEVTWEILLEVCKNFKGTILLVSHDYEFIEHFAPSVFFMMKDGTIAERHKALDELLKEMGRD